MFITKYFFDFLMNSKEGQLSDLRNYNLELLGMLNHERARAEAAVDALLEHKAGVAAIRNADLAREEALHREQQGEPPADLRMAEMQRIFSSVAGVGDDEAQTDADRRAEANSKLDTIGGFSTKEEAEHV